jgi:hypothetical protein
LTGKSENVENTKEAKTNAALDEMNIIKPMTKNGKRHLKIKLKNKMAHQRKAKKNTRTKTKKKQSINKEENVKSQRQESSSCRNVSCLNNLLKTLKVNKDNVVNFFAQKKRMDRSMEIAGSLLCILF